MSCDIDPDKSRTGSDPDRLKIEGDWKAAVGKAIKKRRPAGGWPKPEAYAKSDEKPAQKMGRQD